MDRRILNRLDELTETLRNVKMATDYLTDSVRDIRSEDSLHFTIKCTASLVPELTWLSTHEYEDKAMLLGTRYNGNMKHNKPRLPPLQFPYIEDVETRSSDLDRTKCTESTGTQCTGGYTTLCMENVATQVPSPDIRPDTLAVGTQFPSELCLADQPDISQPQSATACVFDRQNSRPDDITPIWNASLAWNGQTDKVLCRVHPQKTYKSEVTIPAGIQNEIEELKRSSLHLDLDHPAELSQLTVKTNTKPRYLDIDHPAMPQLMEVNTTTKPLHFNIDQGTSPVMKVKTDTKRVILDLDHPAMHRLMEVNGNTKPLLFNGVQHMKKSQVMEVKTNTKPLHLNINQRMGTPQVMEVKTNTKPLHLNIDQRIGTPEVMEVKTNAKPLHLNIDQCMGTPQVMEVKTNTKAHHLNLDQRAGASQLKEIKANTKPPSNIPKQEMRNTSLDMLREQGCIPQLGKLLELQRMAMWLQHLNADTAVSTTINAVNNLAVNEQNNKEMETCVPTLVDISLDVDTGEAVCLSSLQALTNLSVTNEHHGHYTRLVQRLYELLSMGNTALRLQALKILINLSCNSDMVPHLLAAKAPTDLLDLLSPAHTDEAVILRFVTLLTNVLNIVKMNQLTPSSLPSTDKAASPETMYSELLGLGNVGKLKNKMFLLCKHSNKDIKSQAAKVYGLIK